MEIFWTGVATIAVLLIIFVVLPAMIDSPTKCHEPPLVRYTPEQAHRVTQKLKNCDVGMCEAKACAFRTLCQAGRTVPAPMAKW
ncbi:hypothetical protein [Nocardia sp. NPDC057440]|uniref:hypothetical protein n=1 Tax=Nocardia sp. NPDC057440 TaxID=3346134 RepID=UPI00366FCB14